MIPRTVSLNPDHRRSLSTLTDLSYRDLLCLVPRHTLRLDSVLLTPEHQMQEDRRHPVEMSALSWSKMP